MISMSFEGENPHRVSKVDRGNIIESMLTHKGRTRVSYLLTHQVQSTRPPGPHSVCRALKRDKECMKRDKVYTYVVLDAL